MFCAGWALSQCRVTQVKDTQWMFSLTGETDAPIPATSSSHTPWSSTVRGDAQSCTVAATGGVRVRATGAPGGGPGRRTGAEASFSLSLFYLFFPPFFYRTLDTHTHTVKESAFLGGCSAPASHSPRAMASTDRSTGARELSSLYNPCNVVHVTDTM